jgi:micrococcal nuclease
MATVTSKWLPRLKWPNLTAAILLWITFGGCNLPATESTYPASNNLDSIQSDAEGAAFIGNSSTKIFHLAECRTILEMAASNRTWHDTIEKAESRGYRPCKVCKPAEVNAIEPNSNHSN